MPVRATLGLQKVKYATLLQPLTLASPWLEPRLAAKAAANTVPPILQVNFPPIQDFERPNTLRHLQTLYPCASTTILSFWSCFFSSPLHLSPRRRCLASQPLGPRFRRLGPRSHLVHRYTALNRVRPFRILADYVTILIVRLLLEMCHDRSYCRPLSFSPSSPI